MRSNFFCKKRMSCLEIYLVYSDVYPHQPIYRFTCTYLEKKIDSWKKSNFANNSFRRNSVTYRTPCHAIGYFVFWYHHVTNGTPCHPSGYLVICRECYRVERMFFTLRRFLPYTNSLPAGVKASLGAGSWTSKLAGLHADLENIAPAQLFIWITTTHKEVEW